MSRRLSSVKVTSISGINSRDVTISSLRFWKHRNALLMIELFIISYLILLETVVSGTWLCKEIKTFRLHKLSSARRRAAHQVKVHHYSRKLKYIFIILTHQPFSSLYFIIVTEMLSENMVLCQSPTFQNLTPLLLLLA